MNGRDVTDRPFTVKPNDVLNNIVLTYSDRPSELSGALPDTAGKPASSYTVVLFSADRVFWGFKTPRIAQARPTADGRFRFSNLLAGEYYLSALTGVDETDLFDPAFFEQLVNTSIKITLAEGEKKTQDLRLAGRR